MSENYVQKSPDDKCHGCGHARYQHNPPKSFAYAKSGGSSGKAHEIPILARRCCWSNPLCTCLGFEDAELSPEDALAAWEAEQWEVE